MKKLITLIVMCLFASLSAFCDEAELRELAREFINKGTYIEFTKTDQITTTSYIKEKKPGGFILKSAILKMYVSDYGLQVVGDSMSYPFLLEKYDIKLDKESNIIITLK